MARLLALLAACTLFLALGTASVVHAVEPVACGDTLLLDGHADDDRDRTVGDSGKAMAHGHGGCHGHHSATTSAPPQSPAQFAADGQHAPARLGGVPTQGSDPALRPPIA